MSGKNCMTWRAVVCAISQPSEHFFVAVWFSLSKTARKASVCFLGEEVVVETDTVFRCHPCGQMFSRGSGEVALERALGVVACMHADNA